MATGEQGTEILQGIRNASRTFDQPLKFPTVLKAAPAQLPSEPFIQTEPAPPSEPNAPVQPIQPIPAHQLPEDVSIPASDPTGPVNRDGQLHREQVDGAQGTVTAPHPMLRESDALFAPERAQPLELETEIAPAAAPSSPASLPPSDSFIHTSDDDLSKRELPPERVLTNDEPGDDSLPIDANP